MFTSEQAHPLLHVHLLFVDVDMRTEPSEMTDVELGVDNFASSARAGRRNAIPDIQGSAGTGGTSELPFKLETLSIKEGNSTFLLQSAVLLSEPILSSARLPAKCWFLLLLTTPFHLLCLWSSRFFQLSESGQFHLFVS